MGLVQGSRDSKAESQGWVAEDVSLLQEPVGSAGSLGSENHLERKQNKAM